MTHPTPRQRVLDAVRGGLGRRPATDHPGAFLGQRPPSPEASPPPAAAFASVFQAAGGEVVSVPDAEALAAWWTAFSADFASAAVGTGVPRDLAVVLPEAPPSTAEVGLSAARGAVAETGSLMLGAEDLRATQLLPPTHVVLVPAASIHTTLREALMTVRNDLPSAIGLHSGPSKSADIGQILVRGVHGPGRVVAVLVGP